MAACSILYTSQRPRLDYCLIKNWIACIFHILLHQLYNEKQVPSKDRVKHCERILNCLMKSQDNKVTKIPPVSTPTLNKYPIHHFNISPLLGPNQAIAPIYRAMLTT